MGIIDEFLLADNTEPLRRVRQPEVSAKTPTQSNKEAQKWGTKVVARLGVAGTIVELISGLLDIFSGF